jgi:hypothetical protein
MSKERLTQAFDLAYECLRQKINGGLLQVENEASLQLQFAAILKSVGELLEIHRNEFFSIELEKAVNHSDKLFGKSGSNKAKVDLFCSYTNASTDEVHSCAVEIKYFKKKNHREPNNRYDVFADIHNLENYGSFADCCFLIVATDHDHYVDQANYSVDTCDFDFRHGHRYNAQKECTYRTAVPYGKPITLQSSYSFLWDTFPNGLHFMKLAVNPKK